MKKILGYAVLVVVLIYGCRQTSWMISRGGNLNIFVRNSSDVEIVTLEVFVNGESILVQDHSNEKPLNDKGLALYKSTGPYEVKVVSAKHGIAKTARFDLITVKWINIEFVNDENDPNQYDLELSVRSSPVSVE